MEQKGYIFDAKSQKLRGFSALDNTPVTAGSSILKAIGQLQGQINSIPVGGDYVQKVTGAIKFNFPSSHSLQVTTNNGSFTESSLLLSDSGASLNFGLGSGGSTATIGVQSDGVFLSTNPLSPYGIRMESAAGVKFQTSGDGVFGYYSTILSDNITSNRDFQFPDSSGTFALTNDLTGYVPINLTTAITISMAGNLFKIVDGVNERVDFSQGFYKDTSGIMSANINSRTLNLPSSGFTALNWNSTANGLQISNFGSTFSAFLKNTNLTAGRTYQFPNIDGTFALTVNKLNAFAATTSAELAGVISDETGVGSLVFATSPTLVTPVLGVATGTSLTLTSTTEQLRLRYDASNYMSTTIGSTGNTVITLIGTNPFFTFTNSTVFSNQITAGGVFTTNNTGGNAGFRVYGAGSTNHNTTETNLLFGGASTVYGRIWMRGNENFLPVAGSGYGSLIVGSQAVTIAATGSHGVFAQAVFKPLTLTTGGGTVTQTATVYIEGAATTVVGASANYSLIVNSGSSRFQGQIELPGSNAILTSSNPGQGLKICSSNLQYLAFWNATPIMQPANTVSINDLLVNTGLRASGGVSYFSNALVIGNVAATNASVALEINSTTQAFVLPRMTTVQKNALTATIGMVVYDTTLGSQSTYNGSLWM